MNHHLAPASRLPLTATVTHAANPSSAQGVSGRLSRDESASARIE
jgi:hypothetical protein